MFDRPRFDMGRSLLSPRRALAAGSVALFLAAGQTPADASIFVGECTINLNFSFSSGVGPLTKPSYSFSGSQTGLGCVLPIGGPFSDTSISGSGSSTLWSCGAVVSSGSWSQTFSAPAVPNVSGFHFMEGTWGAWTMVLTGSNFAAVVELTTVEAAKVASCGNSSITSIAMTGVQVFADP